MWQLRKTVRLMFPVILSGLFAVSLHAQIDKQVPRAKKYVQAAVYDSAAGIKMYEKLNVALGGDSVRYTIKGYACTDWVDDFYENGQLVHHGYYVQGQLKTYKNFYDNGQVERHFRLLTLSSYQMTLYWQSGKVRSDVAYVDGQANKTSEYYENGNAEFFEEYSKKNDYLVTRKFFFENGWAQRTTELLDAKRRKYQFKEFHENGQLEEEGILIYHRDVDDLIKDGTWKTYDETGKLILIQEFSVGQLSSEKKM
jgi:antitoxin component YwqK of YwqJK toxin-antitoxin module